MRTDDWTASAGPDRSGRGRTGLIVNVVLALLAAAVLTWAFLLVRGTVTPSAATSSSIRTVTVATGPVIATVTADGSLAAASTASASFATSGTVTEIKVKVGQAVTKGELLAQVDPAAADRALALAQANLAAANDALNRAGSGAGRTAAADQVTLATLAVSDAMAQVAGTRLTAPMAGTVVAVNGTIGGSSSVSAGSTSAGSTSSGSAPVGSASVGSASSAGTGFIDLADLTRLQVTADFAEADATKLKAGQDATITWSALTDAEAGGTVLAVDPAATTNNSIVTYGVTITVDALPAGAKPGQTVSVSVVTGKVPNATYVNSAAVKVSGGRYTVTVLTADGTQSTRPVKVGLTGDDAYEITSGLTAGEKVVLPRTSATATTTGDRGPGGSTGGGGPGGGGPGGLPVGGR